MLDTFYGKVEEGKLKLSNPNQFNNKLRNLEGKNVKVSLETRKNSRTLAQNGYYWGIVLGTISDYTGYEVEDLHNHFKYHFLKRKVGNLDTFKSTTELNTKEFSDYIEHIRKFANQVIGIDILTPEDAGYVIE